VVKETDMTIKMTIIWINTMRCHDNTREEIQRIVIEIEIDTTGKLLIIKRDVTII